MKTYMCADMKAKHASIQKSYRFEDPMYIFIENGSVTVLHTYADQTSVLGAAKFFPVLNK